MSKTIPDSNLYSKFISQYPKLIRSQTYVPEPPKRVTVPNFGPTWRPQLACGLPRPDASAAPVARRGHLHRPGALVSASFAADRMGSFHHRGSQNHIYLYLYIYIYLHIYIYLFIYNDEVKYMKWDFNHHLWRIHHNSSDCLCEPSN